MCDNKEASHPQLRLRVFFAAVFFAAGFLPISSGFMSGHTLKGMLWVKSLHILFVMSWVAGLFYLPRILVNLAMVPAQSEPERERLLLMGSKLLRFTTLLAVPAIGFGAWLWLGYGFAGGWLHAKLALVAVLLGYHHACARLLSKFEQRLNTRSHRWFRLFNELAVLVVFAIVVLVVVKPF